MLKLGKLRRNNSQVTFERVSAVELAELRGQVQAIGRSQAVIEFALDGTIQRANDNFLKAVGYSLEEIRGQHHRMFVDPAERESAAYQRFWVQLAHGEYQAGQFRRIAKGGRELWLQASYNPIFGADGKPFVEQSGNGLADIVASVKKVTDIVGEISAASAEQASGIEQVGKAVASMDEAAQQNAALVEQAAAASESIVQQVRELNSSVTDDGDVSAQGAGSGRGMSGGAGGRQAGLARVRVAAQLS